MLISLIYADQLPIIAYDVTFDVQIILAKNNEVNNDYWLCLSLSVQAPQTSP